MLFWNFSQKSVNFPFLNRQCMFFLRWEATFNSKFLPEPLRGVGVVLLLILNIFNEELTGTFSEIIHKKEKIENCRRHILYVYGHSLQAPNWNFFPTSSKTDFFFNFLHNINATLSVTTSTADLKMHSRSFKKLSMRSS